MISSTPCTRSCVERPSKHFKNFSHPSPSPAPFFTALTPTHACSTKLSSSAPPKIARVLLADIAKRIQRRSGAEMGADTWQAATFQRDLSGSPRVLGDLEVSPAERPRGVRTEHLGQHASALPTGHAAERCVCAGGTICFHPSATGAGRKWSPARGGGLRQGPRSGPMTAARAGTAWGEAERPAQSRRSSYAASAEGVGTAAPKRERPTAALRPLSSMAPPSTSLLACQRRAL